MYTHTHTHTHARLENDYYTTCTHTHDYKATIVRRAHTRTTRERLLHDYYTTCTNIDINRYKHTHTHTYTHTIHTHTLYTHNTYTIHTQHKKRRTTLQQKCVVQQEAANYVHADLRSQEAKEVEATSKTAAPEI
jgi:hypothetical protein